jgi:hypothetical protein
MSDLCPYLHLYLHLLPQHTPISGSDDPRLGDLIKSLDRKDLSRLQTGDVVIIGWPYDEGTGINHGRLGGKDGFATFWKMGKLPSSNIRIASQLHTHTRT